MLITGALDFVVEPLRPLFDEVVCASLGVDATGRFTGRLDQLPPTGEARALVLAEYAAREGLDLGESVAYADSTSDLPLLECVGFPVAVNPEARAGRHRPAPGLARGAVGQGRWGGGRPLLPIGSRRPRRVALVGPRRGHARRPTGRRPAARASPVEAGGR